MNQIPLIITGCVTIKPALPTKYVNDLEDVFLHEEGLIPPGNFLDSGYEHPFRDGGGWDFRKGKENPIRLWPFKTSSQAWNRTVIEWGEYDEKTDYFMFAPILAYLLAMIHADNPNHEYAGKFEVLSENRVDDGTDASPAIVGRQLFLRGTKFLYCFENPPTTK
ncbi:hypothetical protein LCGC14_2770620 [marine sediment metagenome]|uniref:Uncharacterized protein n=1 Tax=marine sediment metagenome TaxID=412755 RepID=A0A0F8YWC2_9ZZZZ